MTPMGNTKQTLLALLLLVGLLMCVWMLLTSVHQENVCWEHGYQTPIYYDGQCWCFGRDGEGVAVPMALLEATER